MEISFKKEADSIAIARINPGNKLIYVNPTNKKYDDRFKKLTLEGDLEFIPLPVIQEGQRLAIYASGISGSGKSTSVSKFIKELKKDKNFKEYPTYFFTGSSSYDKAFDGIENFYRIDLNNPLTLHLKIEELKESICIFDDWRAVSDKDIKDFLEDLVKQLLEHSRKNKTEIFIVNHLTQDYSKTKLLIFECNGYFLYPSFNLNSVLKFLKAYLDMDKNQLEEIKKMNTRWIYVSKTAPQYLVSQREIILL